MKKNIILLSIRKQKKMTQLEFALWLNVPYKTYKSYENYNRIPREKRANILVEKLKPFGVVSSVIFSPIDEEKTYSEIIAKYMSNKSRELLSVYISSIEKAIKIEPRDRPPDVHEEVVNKRVAQKANELLGINTITDEDVFLFKQFKLKIHGKK